MTDLDARVAALMEFVDAYADTQFRDEYETHDAEITQARDAAVTAIRAELQKPALHEPIADEEIILAINIANGRLPDGAGQRSRMRRALESFLQSRAKPALDGSEYLGHYAESHEVSVTDKPAQEEITDAVKLFKTSVVGVGPYCVEFHDGEIVCTRTEERQKAIARAVIRASKGEKT